MDKLTAEKCRMAIESIKMRQASIREEIYLQALEIALPVLEQQESDGDTFIVMRNPGKVPDIKRPVGDLADYLLQLYQHNPDAVCDVVTYRFSGVSGQWVQDGRELLAMAGVVLEQQERGNDGWIEWGGGKRPVKGDTILETRWSDGDTVINRADNMNWEHHATYCNLIAYRVVERGEEE